MVRGSAVNQDGRSNGLTAPNAPSQRDVITRALRSADVAASTVNYIETHGTGTGLGDPIEFDALAAVYGKGDVPCALGAVKTNMGHLEAAAGVAGFIKTVLTLQRGKIAPNLNFEKWNPQIDPKPTRLFVPTAAAEWPKSEHPRRGAVSSFGMGGTNAHIVLEQGPEPVPAAADTGGVVTLVVSGRTPARLAASAASLADWLEGDGAAAPLADVAYTVNHHRSRHQTIATVCARTHAEAVTGLRALADGRPAPGVAGARDAKVGSGTVFLYSGQGAQWAGMGKALLAEEPAFAAAVDELEPAFLDKVGFSLRQTLEAGEPVVGIDRIQPVLVGMQLALTELWRSYGVEPDAVIGHSMGETTAAVVAGVLTPAEGLDVIATRTRLMKRLSGQGAMALLELDAQATEKLIADRPDVTVAVYASPKQSVIAGPPDQVDELVAMVDAQGKLARRVEVDVASHHPTIDPVLPELREALAYLAPAAPKIPLISTVAYAGDAPMYSADYWAANLRNPVRFSQAVHEAGAEHSNFIEISPHPLLAHAISDTLAAQSTNRRYHVGATVNRDQPETLAFHAQLSAVRPPAVKEPEDASGRLVSAPPTAWQHASFWMADRSAAQGFSGAHPLLGLHVELPSGNGHVWQSDVGLQAHPWLADHIVHGLPVMPGAGFAEIALAAGAEALGLPATGVEVSVEVEQMLPLDEHTKLTTQLTRDEDGTLRVEIHSRSDAGSWTRHATGTVRAAEDTAAPAKVVPTADGTPVSPSEFYTALRRTGAHHAHAFAALTRIVRSSGTADTEIVLPDEATPHRGITLHPVLLDAALQGLAAAMTDETLADSTDVTYLPVGFGSLRVFGAPGRRAKCRAELVSVVEDSGDAVGRVTLTDDTGAVLARVDDVHLKRIQRRTVPLPLSQKIFDSRWVESAVPAGGPATGSWLALADGADGLARAQEFATRFGGDTRRVVTADLADEAAVREAFATATADPDLPPAGVVVFVSNPDFDGTDAANGLEHARDVIWRVAGTVRAIVGSWHGRAPRLWLVTEGGLVVIPRTAREPGRQQPQGPGAGARLRAPGPEDHAARRRHRRPGRSADRRDRSRRQRRRHRVARRHPVRRAAVPRHPARDAGSARGAQGRVLRRHRCARRCRHVGGPLAGRQRRRPARAQRPQRPLRRGAVGARRTVGPRRDLRRHRRCRAARGGRATGRGRRGDRQAAARPDPFGRRARRRDLRRPDPREPGQDLGAEGRGRAAPARGHRCQGPGLVGRLLVDRVAAGFARPGRLRLRERVAGRAGRLASCRGTARDRDQLGPVGRGGSGQHTALLGAGPDHPGRGRGRARRRAGRRLLPGRHRPAAAGPRRGGVPGDPPDRLLRRPGR